MPKSNLPSKLPRQYSRLMVLYCYLCPSSQISHSPASHHKEGRGGLILCSLMCRCISCVYKFKLKRIKIIFCDKSKNKGIFFGQAKFFFFVFFFGCSDYLNCTLAHLPKQFQILIFILNGIAQPFPARKISRASLLIPVFWLQKQGQTWSRSK